MWEIFFQPKQPLKIKGRLVGVYITDEKKWLAEQQKEIIDKMIKLKADTLFVRPDAKRFNFTCYIDYCEEFDETYIHIVVKEV